MKPTRLPRRNPEAALQIACVQWLECCPGLRSKCEWYHVPNQRTSIKERVALAAMGVQPGVTDLVFETRVGKPSLFIELKAKGGRFSPEQKEFRFRIERLGHNWLEVRTIQELFDALCSAVIDDERDLMESPMGRAIRTSRAGTEPWS